MENIIVIGSSTHAAVVLEAIECLGVHLIQGLVTASPGSPHTFFGYPLLGPDSDLPALVAGRNVRFAVVAIGDNFVRSQVAEKTAAACPRLEFATIVHPGATVSRSAIVGAGTVICAGATVSAGARIGRHCIVNTNASLDHFSRLDDFASIAPNAAVGGNVTIGHHAAIGLGANIIHGITIGEHVVVGAGATVLHDIRPQCVAFGTPAREIRDRTPDEPYL